MASEQQHPTQVPNLETSLSSSDVIDPSRVSTIDLKPPSAADAVIQTPTSHKQTISGSSSSVTSKKNSAKTHHQVSAVAPESENEEEKAAKLKRVWMFRNDKDVINLCTNNGITEPTFVTKLKTVTRLEMCHFNYPNIVGLSPFAASLTTLCLVAQDVRSMVGLEECTGLEELWICETRISAICGLENCRKLKRLFLYSNKIKRIQGLETLENLETLWLSDNEITRIEKLRTLKSLKELHLGNNKISSIGESLNENMSLETLNISGNKLSSFRDILFLAILPSLTSLSLSDPNYADNPLCSLSNYQTHVIYHLPQLHILDTLDVTDESRRIISATVLKKRMYYNMRIRTIKRNTNFLIKMLQVRTDADAKQIEDVLVDLLKAEKVVQRMYDDLELPQGSSGVTQLEESRVRVRQLVDSKMKILDNFHQHKRDVVTQIIEQSDMAIRKLLMELETGGNVRFEDDQSNETWFEICESLVKSMILRSNHVSENKRIQIHRISKIHNRHLKNTFETKVKAMTEPLHSLEYICFQGVPFEGGAATEDIFQSVEHGFTANSSLESTPSGIQKTVLTPAFTNFLDFADSESREDRKKLRQAIILRTVANRCARISEDAARNGINLADYPNVDLFFYDLGPKSAQGDVPCRHYFVANKELATPEFFVEFSLECDLDRFTTKSEKLMLDIAYSNKLSQADMPTIVTEIAKKISENDDGSGMFDAFTMPVIEAQFPEVKRIGTLQGPPPIELTLDVLSKKAPANITHLNFSLYSKLPPMTTFRLFSSIRNLILSQCCLKEIPANLKYFQALEKLDLSFNEISTIANGLIDSASRLKELDLAGNQISLATDLALIQSTFVDLVTLDLRLNPVCKCKGYIPLLLGFGGLLKLDKLDGRRVDASVKHADTLSMILNKKVECATEGRVMKTWSDVYYEHSSTQQHLFRPLSVRTQSGYGSSAALNEYWRITGGAFDGHVFVVENITTLELDNCNLYNLDMLPIGLIHLRWASFRNNNIRDVSRLSLCPRLEELSLEDNEIESIDSLTSLAGLTKLDVSKNRISAVESAANFTSLMLLSLENNLIKSIKPFSKMNSLMEFYIGNNCISDLYNIFPLKELPRLIILDVTGNQVCQQNHYRMFTIFHLSRLKILDGASITPKEQASAKEIYLGKLTIELLGAKIGHFSFRNISELDLRNCKIREADCFVGSYANEFRNIRRLQFDSNQLSTLDAFAGLQGLRCLCLNNNRVEKLLSADLPAVVGLNGWRVDNLEFQRRNIFPNLEELHLGNNNISRIADLGLYRLGQLKRLYLQGNKITRIDGLEHMTTLVELVLDRNQIKSADPSSFLSLINLKELHIKENRLRSLSHFDCLPNLQYLFLNANRISEVIEIEKMKLPSLLEISLISNTITRKILYRVVAVLRFPQIVMIDGRDVNEDDRKRAEAYSMDQCLLRDETANMMKPAVSMGNVAGVNMSAAQVTQAKLPIRITSVVLDGLEMKLAANSSGFGSNSRILRE
ncbi:L domain-like protein [Rhizoclosmatium globosum]|uniref:L domain-like protein n=1 Tax=Rhizoclosmatium globosum TaxID=329046 RepID=A0A1Y2BYI2_9FUNG|nr:L domain-like protein [Rhizoclosmatium globosum]|eukprot:ORY39828.1 L domain-like protein [Rhizoclosmatium globosum]